MRRMSKIAKTLFGAAVILFLVFTLAGHAGAQSVTLISDDPVHTFPLFIATDGVDLFVTGPTSGGGQSIFKIPIGGGTVTTLYPAINPNGITVLGPNIFWIDPNSGPITDTQILRAPKDGSGPITAIYTGAFVGQPIVDGSDITTDGVRLFSADQVQGRVHSLDPNAFPPLLSLANGMTFLGSRFGGFFNTEHRSTIVESGGTLFIADGGCVCPGGTFIPTVVSIPKTGGPFTTLHTGAPLVSPAGIAVGNGTIFIADPGANTIWSMPTSGGTPTALVSGAPFTTPFGLTLFNNALFVTDIGNARIWKVDLSTAKGLKEDAVTELNAVKDAILGGAPGVGNVEDAVENLDAAIAFVQASLASFQPGDSNRLVVDLLLPDGTEFFNNEEDAVEEIFDAVDSGEITDATLLIQLQNIIISKILEADKIVAQTAIDDAVAAGGDPEDIADAQAEFATAEGQAAACTLPAFPGVPGPCDDAVGSFEDAWQNAQKAVGAIP